MSGATTLYYGFLRHLRRPSVARRIAPLQLAGRLEDYLIKELISFVAVTTAGARFAEPNTGRSGEQKLDFALIRARRPEEDLVEAFFEAKYVRNRHRRSDHDFTATDEIWTTIRDLQRQLRFRACKRHGRYPLRLMSRGTAAYGLVFASYTRRDEEPDRCLEFYKRVLAAAERANLRYHDLLKPYFRPAYIDRRVRILGQLWLVSLQIGLWRPRATRGA